MTNYAMFSDFGNAAVHGIVVLAKVSGSTWLEVYQALVNLSDIEGFAEATDTEVRECVYTALNFNTEFYI